MLWTWKINMKLLILVAALLAVTSAASISLEDPEVQASKTAMQRKKEYDVELYDNNSGDIDQEFEIWKKKYGKTYTTPEEEAGRRQAWLKTRVSVTEHNRKYLAGKETWTMGANMFADMLKSCAVPSLLIWEREDACSSPPMPKVSPVCFSSHHTLRNVLVL
ncbi:cystein proteinase inhibitor protein salarin-like isoform X2 [Conger conger]|uniref:cystein proteinase inhibitor protein salarin-like isoform X2 n=1 Tax=Conger conger TaxID=82655 RepID=UPI002A5A5A62|nr:cystein proteinase inhibitor protein salarin-like isoform X2 [Conger conger]